MRKREREKMASRAFHFISIAMQYFLVRVFFFLIHLNFQLKIFPTDLSFISIRLSFELIQSHFSLSFNVFSLFILSPDTSPSLSLLFYSDSIPLDLSYGNQFPILEIYFPRILDKLCMCVCHFRTSIYLRNCKFSRFNRNSFKSNDSEKITSLPHGTNTRIL